MLPGAVNVALVQFSPLNPIDPMEGGCEIITPDDPIVGIAVPGAVEATTLVSCTGIVVVDEFEAIWNVAVATVPSAMMLPFRRVRDQVPRSPPAASPGRRTTARREPRGRSALRDPGKRRGTGHPSRARRRGHRRPRIPRAIARLMRGNGRLSLPSLPPSPLKSLPIPSITLPAGQKARDRRRANATNASRGVVLPSHRDSAQLLLDTLTLKPKLPLPPTAGSVSGM